MQKEQLTRKILLMETNILVKVARFSFHSLFPFHYPPGWLSPPPCQRSKLFQRGFRVVFSLEIHHNVKVERFSAEFKIQIVFDQLEYGEETWKLALEEAGFRHTVFNTHQVNFN